MNRRANQVDAVLLVEVPLLRKIVEQALGSLQVRGHSGIVHDSQQLLKLVAKWLNVIGNDLGFRNVVENHLESLRKNITVIIRRGIPVCNSPRSKSIWVNRNQVTGHGSDQSPRKMVMIAQDEMAQHTGDTLHVMIVWRINHLEELISVTLQIVGNVVYAREADTSQILVRQKFLIFIRFSIRLEVGMAAEEQTPSPRVVGACSVNRERPLNPLVVKLQILFGEFQIVLHIATTVVSTLSLKEIECKLLNLVASQVRSVKHI